MANENEEVKVETPKKETSTKPKQQKNMKKEATPVIYVGPNLAGGRLSSFTVFREGVPAHLKDLIEKHPEIQSLIVPLSKMQKAQTNSSKSGTLEHKAYKKLQKGRVE